MLIGRMFVLGTLRVFVVFTFSVYFIRLWIGWCGELCVFGNCRISITPTKSTLSCTHLSFLMPVVITPSATLYTELNTIHPRQEFGWLVRGRKIQCFHGVCGGDCHCMRFVNYTLQNPFCDLSWCHIYIYSQILLPELLYLILHIGMSTPTTPGSHLRPPCGLSWIGHGGKQLCRTTPPCGCTMWSLCRGGQLHLGLVSGGCARTR